jgi:hypothetical protein
MAESPKGSDQIGVAKFLFSGNDCGYGDYVVRVSSVTHPEKKSYAED